MRRALAGLLLIGAPAAAGEALPPYPPAACAALWEAFADRFGDGGERALAARFRAWSERLLGPTESQALEAEHRPWMADLIRAYVEDGDDRSRELFERLARACGEAAGDLP